MLRKVSKQIRLWTSVGFTFMQILVLNFTLLFCFCCCFWCCFVILQLFFFRFLSIVVLFCVENNFYLLFVTSRNLFNSLKYSLFLVTTWFFTLVSVNFLSVVLSIGLFSLFFSHFLSLILDSFACMQTNIKDRLKTDNYFNVRPSYTHFDIIETHSNTYTFTHTHLRSQPNAWPHNKLIKRSRHTSPINHINFHRIGKPKLEIRWCSNVHLKCSHIFFYL